MDFSIICVTHTGVGEEAIKDCLAMNDLKELNSLDFMKYDRPKNKEEKVAFADKYYKILEEKIDKNKIGPGTIILVDFPGCYSAAVSTKFALKRKDVCVVTGLNENMLCAMIVCRMRKDLPQFTLAQIRDVAVYYGTKGIYDFYSNSEDTAKFTKEMAAKAQAIIN